MSDSNKARNPGATWLIAIVAAFIVLASILAGLFLLRNADEAATAEVQMTPITGGTTAPTETRTCRFRNWAMQLFPPSDGW